MKTALLLGGVHAGMLAQVFITANTMTSPAQHQRVSPARRFFTWWGKRPDWVKLLKPRQRQKFAAAIGAIATKAGYGSRHSTSDSELALPRRRQGIDWERYLNSPGGRPPRFEDKKRL